ncbi:RYamide receptor-like [Oculina patagonica]
MLDAAGIAIATVHSALVVIDIVGNCLVCAIVKKNRDMRTPVNYLLINLAVSDILYAAFIAPDVSLKLISTHPEGMVGTVLCKLLTGGAVAWIGAVSSFVTLVVIAIERYYAVVYPLGNKGKLTKHKVKVIIFGSWVFAIIYCVPLFLTKSAKKNVCVETWPQEWMIKAYSLGMGSVLVVLSVALMVGFYSRVVYSLWFKRNDDNQLTNQQRVCVMKKLYRCTNQDM